MGMFKFKHIIQLINKSLLISAALLTLSPSIKAQEFYAGGLVGGSFSQVDGDTYAGYHLAAPLSGGFVGRRIAKNWNAQMEIEYTQKGSRKYADIEKGDDRDYLIKLSYIQIPVLVQYHHNSLSFEAGLNIASLLDFKEEANFVPIPADDQVKFSNIDLEFLLGINYHFTKRLSINARMLYSIIPIREPYGGSIEIYDPHWDLHKKGQYNNVISLALYYNLFTHQ